MEREGLAAPRSIPTRTGRRLSATALRRRRHPPWHRPRLCPPSIFDTCLSATPLITKGKGRHTSTVLFFGAHIKARNQCFTVGISGWFFSQQNIPARASMEQFACGRRKGWPRHGRNGWTDVGYNTWNSLWEAYTRTGGPDRRNGTGRMGVGIRVCKADLVFEVPAYMRWCS